VTLELGGKSPQLVFDDAGDLEVLAQRILRGFTANGGQACVAGTRLIVQRNIADPLVERLAQLCREVKPGVTWQEDSRYAPLIDERQGNKVCSVIEAAKAQG
ncbi:aldehyde dehydrogenase family protein, partial [Pantoea agglomerans]